MSSSILTLSVCFLSPSKSSLREKKERWREKHSAEENLRLLSLPGVDRVFDSEA